MKSIRKHTMYLGNRIFGIVYVYLIGMLFLSACAEGERYINNEEESIVALEEVPNSETIYQENIAETRTVEYQSYFMGRRVLDIRLCRNWGTLV